MKKAYCLVLAAVAAVLLLGSCAYGAVSVTWTGGSVDLSLIDNPDAAYEYWWPQVWYGELPISMTSLSPVVFTGTGDLQGVNVIRLKQVATNDTAAYWDDFHIELSGGTFYKKFLVQSGWNATLTQHRMDYVKSTGPMVAPGGTFTDGVVFTVNADPGGNAAFTLTKWPTVPEPAGTAAMAVGLTGFAAFWRRRKA